MRCRRSICRPSYLRLSRCLSPGSCARCLACARIRERPGGLVGPVAPRSGPASSPVAQPDARAAGAGSAASRGSLEGRRRARSCGLERPRRHRRRGSQLFAASLSVRRPGRLRHGRPCFRRRRFRRPCTSLMAPEAFANFDSAIRARAAAGQTMTTTVVSIDNATIVGAQLVGATAQISVRFAAKLASVTRDARGRSRRRVAQHGRRSYRLVDVRARCPLPRSQLAADGDRIGELSRAATLKPLPCGPASSLGFRQPRGLERRRPSGGVSALSSARRGRSPRAESSPRPAQSAAARTRLRTPARRSASQAPRRAGRAALLRDPVSTLPRRSRADGGGFLTGYYEPCVPASPVETEAVSPGRSSRGRPIS